MNGTFGYAESFSYSSWLTSSEEHKKHINVENPITDLHQRHMNGRSDLESDLGETFHRHSA